MSSRHAASLAAVTPEALEEIRLHAAAAAPEECCGLVFDAAVLRCTNVQNEAHERDPRVFPRTARTAFRLSDSEQLLLARSFDSGPPARALYHSHVDAEAYFSAADLAGATLEGEPVYAGLVYVVVAVHGGVAGEARAFAIEHGAALELARFPSTYRT